MHSSGASTPGYRQSCRSSATESKLTCFPVATSTLVVRHVDESNLIGLTDGDAELNGDVDWVSLDNS